MSIGVPKHAPGVWHYACASLMVLFATGLSSAQSVRVGQGGLDLGDRLVTVYSTADTQVILPVLERFAALRPQIGIDYHELQSQDLFERVESEADQTADLVWSSAMDLQMKLVNDGFARRVSIASKSNLPDWASWRDEAYAISVEPAVIVYNKESVPNDQVPQNRAQLLDWLNGDTGAFGTVGTYDIERSGFGLLLAASDADRSRDFWQLVRALGHNQVDLFSSSSALIERVVDGRLSLAYNVIGSYAAARAAQDPRLGIVLPDDYTLVVSRIAFVPQMARNPQLGEELLNYLLSRNGQRVLNDVVGFPAVHQDVTWGQSLFPSPEISQPHLDPLEVDTGLLVYLDQVRRDNLIRQWREALNGAL